MYCYLCNHSEVLQIVSCAMRRCYNNSYWCVRQRVNWYLRVKGWGSVRRENKMWHNFSCGPHIASLEKYKFCVLTGDIVWSPIAPHSAAAHKKRLFALLCERERPPKGLAAQRRRENNTYYTLWQCCLGPCADRYCIYDIFLRRRAQRKLRAESAKPLLLFL